MSNWANTIQSPVRLQHPLIFIILADLLLIAGLSFLSPTAVLAVALGLFLLALFYLPRLGYIYFLIIWLVYEALFISAEGPYEFYRLTAIILLMLLAWLKYLLTSDKVHLPSKPVFIPLLAFYIWSAITVITSPSPMLSLLGYLRYVTYLAMFLLTYNLIKSEKDLRNVLYFTLIVLSPTLIAAVIQSFYLGHYRSSGFFHNPNTLSLFAVLGIAISLCFFNRWKPTMRNNVLFLIIFSISILALWSGGARASMLAFIAFAFAYLYWAKFYKTLACLIVLAIIGAFLLISNHPLMQNLAQYYRFYSGSSGRTFMWQFAIPMIMDHPIFGVGFYTIGEVFTSYCRETHPFVSQNIGGIVKHGLLHNGYLQKAGEVGITGLILYLWANIAFIKYLISAKKGINNPFIKNAAIIAGTLLISRLAFSFVESAEQLGPITTQASFMVIFTSILKVIDMEQRPEMRSG